MNQTSHDSIELILTSDLSLSGEERVTLEKMLMASKPNGSPAASVEPLVLNQKDAAAKLGVTRTTLWRWGKMGILTPVEISPGTIRYQILEIETLAREGYRHLLTRAKKRAA